MALRRLSLIRGDDRTLNVTFVDANNAPFCIKNWAVFFTLKTDSELPDSQASLQKIVTAFSDTTSGTSGLAQIVLEPSDTSSLVPGEYYFDIQVTTNESKTYTVFRGKCEVEYDVTKTLGTAGTAA